MLGSTARKWTNAPGFIEIEFEIQDGQFIQSDGSAVTLPKEIAEVASGHEYLDLVVEFVSTGYYEPMSMYGGPDQLGWPAEGSDERTIDRAYVKLDDDESEIVLPPSVHAELNAMYRDQIEAADIESDKDND